MSFLHRWLSARPVAPKTARPRFRPALHALDDRITPTFGFAAQQSLSVGVNPRAVAVADFNGDGRPDFATADYNANTVSVLLNATAAGAATPTFATRQAFTVGVNPRSVSAGDFNGDGRPDLATPNYGAGTVSVLLNATAAGAGTPTFAAGPTFAVGNGPWWMAVGDFNGDGRPDFVTANRTAGTVSVLLNTTVAGAVTPTFAAQQVFAVGSGPFSVTVGDFNGDGRLDFATANYAANTVSLLLNTTASGAGTPTFATQQLLAVGTGPWSVTAGDLDGDGRLDLITSSYGTSTLSVLLNATAAGAATATFAAPQLLAAGNGSISTAVADYNGDGRPDLATANYDAGTVSVLLNTTVTGAVAPTFATGQTFAVDNFPISVTVGDFNGDGRPDLATANYDASTASVLLNAATDASATTTPALAGQFGATGVWGYNRAANTWANLDTRNATALATAPNGNTVANFAGVGVWYYRSATATWTQINGYAASAVAIDPYGNAYANFGPKFGTAVYRSTIAHWALLPGVSAGADTLAVSANGDVTANFPGFGVFRFRWTTGWQLINGYNATALAVDPNGFVVASFTGFGVGQYIPYANGWRLVTPGGATSVTVDGYGNVFAAFAGYGVGRWSAVTNTWTNLGPGAAATSLAADLFGNLFAAVPGFGVSEYSPLTGWVQRRAGDASILGLGR